MASHDLRKMRVGMMDRHGRKQAKSAQRWGVVGAALSLFSGAAYGLVFAWGLWPLDALSTFEALSLGTLATTMGLVRLLVIVIAAPR
jgi:ABC-type multidrug transport system fused ATPase/permease subunit